MTTLFSTMNAAVFAISDQRAIGFVVAAAIFGGVTIYWLFNWMEGRDEVGAEIELAPNRKEQWGDELMETRRLDISLTAALGTLAVIALALPLYWLGEPGRHDGFVDFREGQFAKVGGGLYEENCAQCHGSVDGPGSVRSYAILDNAGNFVEQVDWKAPSLAAVLRRFSFEEVRYILNYGRQNSPMPAWGAAGGGPMTSQRVDNVILYLAANQLSNDEINDEINAGLLEAAETKAMQRFETEQPALYADLQRELATDGAFSADNRALLLAERDAIYAEANDAPTGPLMGELLFNNPAGSGAYGCARCHSAGWSYSADELNALKVAKGEEPLLSPVVPGGGGFGPSLNGGATASQFATAESQVGFITVGSVEGNKYGNYGQGEGGGQMPAFGQCVADRDAGDRAPIKGHCREYNGEALDGLLSAAQIEAIVAYERGLE